MSPLKRRLVLGWHGRESVIVCLQMDLFLFLLDLQDGGVVVQDGQNDLVHVLPQTEVDVLLFLYGLYELGKEDRGISYFHLLSMNHLP